MRDFTGLTLSTPRLALRPLQESDAEPLFRIYSNPEFMRYWSSAPWTDLKQAISLIAQDRAELATGLHLRLGIVRNADGVLAGTCALFKFDAHSRRAEIGYGVSPDCWRQGIMTEAVGALVEYAFNELGLNRLEADLDPRNTGSARGLEKLGFVREGLLRQRWIVSGEFSDSAIYGLTASDFACRRDADRGDARR